MLISLNWIKKFTDISLEPNVLLERIASQIAEIESVTDLAEQYEGIIVSKIVEAQEHPDADKLRVFQVDTGDKTVQIVSGDPDLEKGDIVALIPPGVAVPGTLQDDKPLVIQSAKMRGVLSDGMVASARELAFGDDHEGVLKLDTDAKPGTPLTQAYELDDTIIEIENKSLTHRPDCFGMLGLAREIAGIQQLQFKSPDWFHLEVSPLQKSADLPLELDNQITDVVPRITLQSFDNVAVKPSPIIMQTYLSRLGVRPINNVVDITNYVMLLTGQPIHAFDYDKVAERSGGDVPKIEVRYPHKGEKLAMLDERTIDPHDKAILIATDEEPISLAGAMGGAETEVGVETKRIILEVANFDLYAIRESSMRHGVFSEAVTRFARGQSPRQIPAVQRYAAQLLGQHAQAEPASELLDQAADVEGPKPIAVDADFINQRLGTDLDSVQMETLLQNTELKTSASGKELSVTPAFWRQDLHIPEDIVEEVGRLYGYNAITYRLPQRSIEAVQNEPIDLLESNLRQRLVRAGANEILTYNFVSEQLLNDSGMPVDNAFRIRNSISPELQRMRTVLSPCILEKVYGNLRQNYDHFALFEIGKAHDTRRLLEDGTPQEFRLLSGVVAASDKHATQRDLRDAYYQARGLLEFALGTELQVRGLADAADELPVPLDQAAALFQANRSAVIMNGQQAIGLVGEYTPAVRRSFKLPQYCAGFELLTEAVMTNTRPPYRPISKYPASQQDITLVTPSEVTFERLKEQLRTHLRLDEVAVDIRSTSIYQSDEQVPSGERNITFRATFQPYNDTLKTQEINQAVQSAVEAVSRELSVRQV